MTNQPNPQRLAIGQWFREAREANGLTQEQVGQVIGLTKGSVSNLENQGTTYKTVLKHAETLQWPVPPLKDILSGDTDPSNTLATVKVTSMRPSAGYGQPVTDEIVSRIDLPAPWLRMMTQGRGLQNLALCTVKGDSMYPTLEDKDTLIVDTSVNTFEVDGIYVFTYLDEILVKRVQKRGKEGGVELISDNRKFNTRTLEEEDLADVTVHAKVLGRWTFGSVK